MKCDKLEEFSLRLIFPFDFKKSLDAFPSYIQALTLETLSQQISIPANSVQALKATSLNQSIWQKFKEADDSTDTRISDDFYPHIRKLLHNTEGLTQVFELTEAAYHILNGGYETASQTDKGQGLALTLTDVAKKRLKIPKVLSSNSLNENVYEKNELNFRFATFDKWHPNNDPNSNINGRMLPVPSLPKLYLMSFGEGFLEINLTLDSDEIEKYGIIAVHELIHALTKVSDRK